MPQIPSYLLCKLCIASHWPFESWGRFLPEHTTAVSLLDRLLHHATVVITSGLARRTGARTRRVAPVVVLVNTVGMMIRRPGAIQCEMRTWSLVADADDPLGRR